MSERIVPKALQDAVENMLGTWIASLDEEDDILAGASFTHPLPNLFYLKLHSGAAYRLILEVPPLYTVQGQGQVAPLPEKLTYEGGQFWLATDGDRAQRPAHGSEVTDDHTR